MSREDGKRRVVVSANLTERGLGSFVADAQTAIAAVAVPTGYWTTRGGTFEQLQSASKRLQIVVPRAMGLVFVLLFCCSAVLLFCCSAVLLFTMFGNSKDGLLVFIGIPFALTAACWRSGCAAFRCRPR